MCQGLETLTFSRPKVSCSVGQSSIVNGPLCQSSTITNNKFPFRANIKEEFFP
jgi:hypothetical protein